MNPTTSKQGLVWVLDHALHCTHIEGGDGAGGVAGDKLDHGGHGPVHELPLRPDHGACMHITSHGSETLILAS